MTWLGAMAQNVNVNGTVTSITGDPQEEVNILVSVFFADSTAELQSVYTDVTGSYTVDIEGPGPNVLGFVEVSMVDCLGTTESQFFTILNGDEIFQADFIYCQEFMIDSCILFIIEEWNPQGQLQLTAWTPPGFATQFSWTTGETTQTIIPQSSGTYCVTAVYPDTTCTLTDCIEVNLDSTGFCFAYIVSYMNPDSSTFNLEVIPSGIAPFAYQWSNGQTTSTLEDVGEGTYCVTVTDASGCSYATCIIVEGFNFCEVYIYEDPGLGGLYAQGYGQMPIYYIWNTGDTSQVLYPNGPGLYCVTMYDAVGCSTSSCYNYGWGQDSCYSYVHAFVSDSNTFALQAIAYTPALPLTYLWSTGETTEYIYPQDPSLTYCATVTDANDCVSTGCFDGSNFCYAWIDLDYVDTSTAILYVYTDSIFNLPGGIPTTYLWSNGATTQVLTVTESGEYCVTVTLGEGCIAEACTYVDFENLGTNCSAWVIQYPDSSGQWHAEAYVWGFGTFEYLWSNGDTNAITAINNPTDFNCVTVTSSFGCETVACADSFYLPCETYISTNYLSNITAELTATIYNDPNQNGTFLWSTGETGPVITVTTEGEYCVTVTGGGCIHTACAYIYFWNIDTCGVWIAADPSSGLYVEYTANAWGIPPFSYLWSNGSTEPAVQIDFGFHDLCVTVTDSIGCVASGCNFEYDSCYVSLYYSPSPYPTIQIQSAEQVASVYWSTGDTLQWLEIAEPGTYCAKVTTIFGCVATTCITIDSLIPGGAQNVISGYVFGDTLVSLQGQVFAYKYELNTGTSFEVADSSLIVNGFYSIDGLADGIYLVKAALEPGSANAADFIPTYHWNSTTWEAAMPHVLPNWLTVTTDILMVSANIPNGGGGVIGGFITDPNRLVAGEDEESRGLGGLSGATVLIKDAQGQPLGYAYSMPDGGFRFTDLPYGTYRISYDIAGLTSPDIWVTLTPENPERLNVTCKRSSYILILLNMKSIFLCQV